MKKIFAIITAILFGALIVTNAYMAPDVLTASGSIMNPGQIGVSALADSMRTLNLDNIYVLRSGDSTLTGPWDAGVFSITTDTLNVGRVLNVGPSPDPFNVGKISVSSVLEINGVSTSPAIIGTCYSINTGTCPSIYFNRSRSSTETMVETINNDYLGKFNYYGVSSLNNLASAGSFAVLQDGSSGTNYVPAKMWIQLLNGVGSSIFEFSHNGSLTVPDSLKFGVPGFANYAITPAAGTSGQVLTMSGSKVATWATPSVGVSIGDAVGSGTAGSALFVDGSGNLGQDNANFYWDDTNNRLGIGTVTPNTELQIGGVIPTATIGDGGAEDSEIIFDGNAQDYYIGLDDTDDNLNIGRGSVVGTTSALEISYATGKPRVGFGRKPSTGSYYNFVQQSDGAAVGMALYSQTVSSWSGFDTYASDGTKTGFFASKKGVYVLGTTYAGGRLTVYTGNGVKALRVSGTQNMFIGGDIDATNRLDIEGACAIGVSYSGTKIAPTNGLLVEGDIGIGTATPPEKLSVEWATGVDAGFFRGTTDLDITGTYMRSPDGTKWYTWVDDTGAFQSSTTKP